MADTEIVGKASFDRIRYAQLWEDADVLLAALGDQRGKTLVSICSAGDNALAMLTLDPARIVAVDMSAAQIECLTIRMSAYRTLDHAGLLELLGSRPPPPRRGRAPAPPPAEPSCSTASPARCPTRRRRSGHRCAQASSATGSAASA